MTDWLPWGFIVMLGTFSTFWLIIRALEQMAHGKTPDLNLAKWVLILTLVLSFGVYVLYIIYGESWIWYLK